MTHVTPSVPVSGTIKMRKVNTGPREETLMLIRQFARIYDPYSQRVKVRKDLLN